MYKKNIIYYNISLFLYMYAFIAPIITLLYVVINNYLLQHIEILLHSVIFIYGMYIANISDIFTEISTINFIFTDKGDHE